MGVQEEKSRVLPDKKGPFFTNICAKTKCTFLPNWGDFFTDFQMLRAADPSPPARALMPSIYHLYQ